MAGLLALSVACWGVIIDKAVQLGRVHRQARSAMLSPMSLGPKGGGTAPPRSRI